MAADEKKEEAKTAAEGVEGGEPSTAVAAPTAEAAAEEAVSKGPEIKLTVKHGQQTHQVAMPEESLVKELMDVLQGVTNVHPRGQKLIFKADMVDDRGDSSKWTQSSVFFEYGRKSTGKILTPEMKFSDAKLTNNAKIMLMATQGVFQGPSGGTSSAGQVAMMRRGMALRSSSPFQRGSGLEAPSPVALAQEKQRQEMWEKTGVVSLRDQGLQVVPGAVWVVSTSLRILDLGNNTLRMFPPAVAGLMNLQRLRLSSNLLSENAIAWDALTRLPVLTALALDHNQITMIPPAIGQLAALKRLSLSHNQLSSLPQEIGQLRNLEWIDVAHNRLAAIPRTLADCSALAEANFSANFIGTVPPMLGRLTNLKILILSNNAIRKFPSDVLKGCSELYTLSLHGNPITIDQLREVDGWEEFDERRRAKYSRRLELQALASSSGLDEGADAHLWHNW